MPSPSHYRPYSGSCPRCHGLLDLAAVRADGIWYCSAACAEGAPGARRTDGVSDSRLTNRPRRFYGRRMPKELHFTQGERSGGSS